MNKELRRCPRLIPAFFALAGLYNVVWGVVMWQNPDGFMAWTQINLWPLPAAAARWLGAVVLLLGVCYLLAAWRPLSLAKVGLLGATTKVAGAAMALHTGWQQGFTDGLWLHLVCNDLIWIFPFCWAWYQLFREKWRPGAGRSQGPVARMLSCYRTSHRRNLATLTSAQPTLVVFMRHLNSVFAQEAVAKLVACRQEVETQGVQIVFVHVAGLAAGKAFLQKGGFKNAEHVSDPEGHLYEAMGLPRGRFMQLFGPRVWWRCLQVMLRGHAGGRPRGDAFRLSGAFLIRDATVVEAFRARRASDCPNYRTLSVPATEARVAVAAG